MIEILRARVADAAQRAVRHVCGLEVELPEVADPPRPKFGDLATPVALQIARQQGRNPRELAEDLRRYLIENPVDGIVDWRLAGPGFLNAVLDRGATLTGLLQSFSRGQEAADELPKVLVEHTSINPNKAAHIGHLRNACLGDTLARVLRHQGHAVEVHNYIDDTGVQVADVVIGFHDLRGMDAEAVAAVPEPFDYMCWDLYTEISARGADDSELDERRREVLHILESGQGPEAEVAAVVVRRIVQRHLLTMGRLGICYDVLVREGDILALDLWSEAFDRLRASDSVYFDEVGKHAGCWMMSLRGTEGFADLEEADKVLVRSNGVATYVAKDIAYHLWKYGLLDRDFGYEPVVDEAPLDDPAAGVWQTTPDGASKQEFGRAGSAVTVIDVRQSYLQSIVRQAFRVIGEDDAADAFTHFAYEMVALSPRTAEAMGIPSNGEAEGRGFVEMSGRRGYGVKADDLLDLLERRATEEVASRNPDLGGDALAAIGRQIAVGAVRYFLLKYTRNTVIVFDLDEALSFEGETGPYVQYAAVRAHSIFDKLAERWDVEPETMLRALEEGRADDLPGGGEVALLDAEGLRARLEDEDHDEIWSLVLALVRFEEVARHAAESMELSGLAKYAFTLAQHFNRFYHSYPILQEEDPRERGLRVLVADAFRRRLATALELLGIPLPERM